MGRVERLFISVLEGSGPLVVVVTFTPLASWYSRLLAGEWNDPRGDVLIVLAVETCKIACYFSRGWI